MALRNVINVVVLLAMVLSPLGRPQSAYAAPQKLAEQQPALAASGSIERVSVSSGGTQGNYQSLNQAISADGRYVVFESDADNLVPSDTNGQTDIFVRDRQSGATERVSIATDGTEADGPSNNPAISADGRYVVFDSLAWNLVSPGGYLYCNQVYLRDLVNHTTEIVSVTVDGTPSDSWSHHPAISADGRYVVFSSLAHNLVPSLTNWSNNVFLRDRQNNTVEAISVNASGALGNDNSFYSSISADGRYVAFVSAANDLAPNDNNGAADVFLHDRVNHSTTLVSATGSGAAGNGPSDTASISADGRFIAYRSDASDLVSGDTNGTGDIFRYSRESGANQLISRASDGTQAYYPSYHPSISGDGRFIAFETPDYFLVPGDNNGWSDIFLRDVANHTTGRISFGYNGTEGDSDSNEPTISADGRYTAFLSYADNLVPSDTNRARDVFVYDRCPDGSCGGTVPVGYAISGKVSDLSGLPIADVEIQSDNGASAVTGADGTYRISGLAAGTYTLNAVKSGYAFAPAWQKVTVSADPVVQDFTGSPEGAPPPQPLDPPPPTDPNVPYISSLSPCVPGPIYLNPWPLEINNLYHATVDWRNQGAKEVVFTLNGKSASETTSEALAEHSYSLTHDYTFGLIPPAKNILSAQAIAANGRRSPVYTLYPIGVAIPTWLLNSKLIIDVASTCFTKDAKQAYKGEFKFPEIAINAYMDVPGAIPILGNCALGIKDTQFGAKWELNSDGEGVAGGFGEGHFKAACGGINGKLGGKGTSTVIPDGGMILKKLSAEVEIGGEIEKKVPLLDLICKAFTGGSCPLKEAESLPIVGGAIKWFNDRAIVKGTISPGVEATLNFKSNPATLLPQWESGESKFKVGMLLALVLDVCKDLTAELYGGGEPSGTLQVPPNPSYLKELAIEFMAGITFKAFGFELKNEGTYETSWSPSGGSKAQYAAGSVLTNSRASGWKPESRSYAANPRSYAVFQAAKQPFRLRVSQAELQAAQGQLTTQTLGLISNVYPQGNPTITPTGQNGALIAWVHDDLSKPVLQAKEIAYSFFDGANWSAPKQVTMDNLQDFAPQAALDQNGRPVLVWERSNTIQPDTATLNAAYLNSFEIAYSVWNGSAWSAPAFLTTNAANDHAPTLVRGNDGTLALLWRQNPSGELIGTSASPETFFLSTWDGAAWSAPEAVMTGAQYVLNAALARQDAAHMTIAYAQDLDGDMTNSADQELFAITWDGAAWSAPLRLTNDALPDSHPTLFYNPADGAPRLLWLKDSGLYALMDGLNGAPQPVTVAGANTILDYAAAQDANGKLALLWQDHSDQGVDIFYAAYDEAQGIFSLVEQMTHDQPLEKFFQGVFTPTGELLLAYNLTQLVPTDMTIGQTTVHNATTFGQTDLYVLRHTFGPDLGWQDGALTVSPANPAPGSPVTLSATLTNLGDEAVAAPAVTFYQGDPTSGGQVIGTASAAQPLPGGGQVTLTLDWTLPATGEAVQVYAVADGANLVAETNESNNIAHLGLALPDLTVTNLAVTALPGQPAHLTATVRNAGASPAPAGSQVTFRRDDAATGALLGTATLGAVAPGAEVTADVDWDAATEPDGRILVFATAGEANALAEADENNNSAWSELALLPDLQLRPDGLRTLRAADGAVTVSVWVFNNGPRPAVNVDLSLLPYAPGSRFPALAQTTIDSIPAGESRVVTFDLGQYAGAGFYAAAGYAPDFVDRSRSDNLLLVGEEPSGPAQVFLPLVKK